MAEKVLKLFWSLAHSQDVTTDIMDQALAAHVKILDYSCTQNRLPIIQQCTQNMLLNNNNSSVYKEIIYGLEY